MQLQSVDRKIYFALAWCSVKTALGLSVHGHEKGIRDRGPMHARADSLRGSSVAEAPPPLLGDPQIEGGAGDVACMLKCLNMNVRSM